jgi:hypothetical protein
MCRVDSPRPLVFGDLHRAIGKEHFGALKCHYNKAKTMCFVDFSSQTARRAFLKHKYFNFAVNNKLLPLQFIPTRFCKFAIEDHFDFDKETGEEVYVTCADHRIG